VLSALLLAGQVFHRILTGRIHRRNLLKSAGYRGEIVRLYKREIEWILAAAAGHHEEEWRRIRFAELGRDERKKGARRTPARERGGREWR
jgi:hypothetical protein